MQVHKRIAQTYLRFPLALFFLALIQACAPYPRDRSYFPPHRLPSPSGVQGERRRPAAGDINAKNQTRQGAHALSDAKSRDLLDSEREMSSPAPAENSLIAKIDPATPPYRAASLRLTEEGRKLLGAGEYVKALDRFEKTVALDAANPYAYYYLAKTHYQMGRYEDSLNFLDVAQSHLPREPYWLAEIHALRGENFHALGFIQRAGSSYSEALRWNPENRIASEGLSRIQGQAPPSTR